MDYINLKLQMFADMFEGFCVEEGDFEHYLELYTDLIRAQAKYDNGYDEVMESDYILDDLGDGGNFFDGSGNGSYLDENFDETEPVIIDEAIAKEKANQYKYIVWHWNPEY